MKRRWILGFAVVIALATGTAHMTRNCWTSQGKLVRGDGFQGIIMDMSRFVATGKTQTWPCGKSEVTEFESALGTLVNSDTNRFGRIATDLDQFYRQYHAVLKDGHRMINAEFFHRDIISQFDWLHRTPIIAGGGFMNWRISYDVDSKTFGRLSVNSEM